VRRADAYCLGENNSVNQDQRATMEDETPFQKEMRKGLAATYLMSRMSLATAFKYGRESALAAVTVQVIMNINVLFD